MSATIRWEQSTEQEGLGIATVSFKDAFEILITEFSGRVDTRDDADIQNFIAQAIKAKDAAIAVNTKRPEILNKIQAVLNSKG